MLELYKNIKERRNALEMSQDTLASLTGYKDRSSIAKIERGVVDIPESKIREFAKALRSVERCTIFGGSFNRMALDKLRNS